MTHAAQALIESLDDGICLVDGAGRIQLFNRRFLEILDLASGSLGPGEPVTRLAHLLRARGEYATEAQFQAALGLLGEAVRRAFRIEYARPGGGAVELSAKPVPEGGFLLCVADIAARWKAAEALRRAEGRARQESPAAETVPNAEGEILLAQAIESIAQGFAIFDPKDRLALMNARYR